MVIGSDGGHTVIWSYGYMVIQSWYTIIWLNVNTVMVKGHGIWSNGHQLTVNDKWSNNYGYGILSNGHGHGVQRIWSLVISSSGGDMVIR